MSTWLLYAVTAAYIATGIDLWLHDRHGLALCFIGYAIANAGLIWDIVKH